MAAHAALCNVSHQALCTFSIPGVLEINYAYFLVTDDHSRVVLKGKNLDQDTDYINANYIDVSKIDANSVYLILESETIM